jgi:hypothetical protein
LSAQGSEPARELALVGGRVWTGPGCPPEGPGAPTALAVRAGRVLAVGSDEAVLSAVGRDAERIELGGRRVVPGFLDAHTHFVRGGLELAGVALRDAATPAELARRIAEHARAHPGEWITGGGWDHELWGGALPERAWIDAASADTPVLVTRLDLHMALANSRALAIAGVTAATPDPSGGTIVRDRDGRPTGVLKDTALSLVARCVPEPGPERRARGLLAAARNALAAGVTAVSDMGTWEDLETWRRAEQAGALPIRGYAVVPLAERERILELVAREGRGGERLTWGGVKAFVDGSLGSTTAWMHAPYDDEPGSTGLVLGDLELMAAELREADAAGLQCLVHAIGDRANDWALDALAAARAANGPRDRRARIEHAQHLSPAAIARFGAEGVIPSMQPFHAADDGRFAERRIGPERARRSFALRALLDAGARPAFGSDWTVAPIDPLLGIQAAVTRRTIDGSHPEGWVPEQRISVFEALEAYTAGAARACFRESDLGRLEPGMRADLVVISDDLFAVPPERPESIGEIRVDLALVGGA